MTTLRHPSSAHPQTDALRALIEEPLSVPERLDPGLRRVLAARIGATAPGRHLGTLRLDSYGVLHRPEAGTDAAPFTWSPRTARRLLGLAAARRVVAGGSPSPLAAVRAEIVDVVARAASARTRPGALGSWLAEAPSGLLGAVTAEATGYATDVVTLLDHASLDGRIEVGQADPVWAAPGAPWVSLRARRDLVVALDPELRTRALVALRPGRPGDQSVDDLGLVALIDALSRPGDPVATRVIGVWPSCGRAISLEVERETMRRAARLVVDAVVVRARLGTTTLAA
jgi:hypothetical protein